jgi:hypothetical protein
VIGFVEPSRLGDSIDQLITPYRPKSAYSRMSSLECQLSRQQVKEARTILPNCCSFASNATHGL